MCETSSNLPFLALLDGFDMLALLSLPSGSELSRCLALQVQELVAVAEPEKIVLGVGPGSYTGIRVGAALAEALAFGKNIPLYTAPSTEAFMPDCGGVILDARGGGVYLHMVGESPKKIPLDKVPPLNDLYSPHPEEIQKRLPHCKIYPASPNPIRLAEKAVFSRLEEITIRYL